MELERSVSSTEYHVAFQVVPIEVGVFQGYVQRKLAGFSSVLHPTHRRSDSIT
jgi:hypothetical protein